MQSYAVRKTEEDRPARIIVTVVVTVMLLAIPIIVLQPCPSKPMKRVEWRRVRRLFQGEYSAAGENLESWGSDDLKS